ncbi:helix-turn-helix domain-containing protein [Teichococcus oryzae]|uniref:DUF4115 domain-containing protein n=1 Tax=Teichococcus oryzae TaxID=1608942 RepID=A0A5B2TAG1_9PROT|nr:helix-turn-helix domain-containing protein [Pseudoroseomonas oryzae]KAA2211512.1 DUF4115 domain-containing protein [Pseudoroseomonas oryzae]
MAYDLKRNPSVQMQSAEAVRVGDELRQARLALGIGLDDLSGNLKINRRYLEALEEGRWRDLPGAAYGAGFIRSYAQVVGMDASDAVRRFREVAGQQGKGRDLVFPEPVPDRGVPTGALVLLGALVALGGYAAWYSWSGSAGRSVDQVAALTPELEDAAREAGQPPLPATRPPVFQAAPPTPAPPSSVATSSMPAPAVPPAGSPSPAAPAPAAPAPPPVSTVAATQPAAQPAFLLRAMQECWIQVRDPATNRVVLSRLLQVGEAWQVPQRSGLLLTTGRIEALAVEVDGTTSAAFTNQMGVRRDIALDAERLKAAEPGQIPAREPPAR